MVGCFFTELASSKTEKKCYIEETSCATDVTGMKTGRLVFTFTCVTLHLMRVQAINHLQGF